MVALFRGHCYSMVALFRGHRYSSMVALFRGHRYSMVVFGILIADIPITKFCLKIPHSPFQITTVFLFLQLYTP